MGNKAGKDIEPERRKCAPLPGTEIVARSGVALWEGIVQHCSDDVIYGQLHLSVFVCSYYVKSNTNCHS